jgi:hypothetical protein
MQRHRMPVPELIRVRRRNRFGIPRTRPSVDLDCASLLQVPA